MQIRDIEFWDQSAMDESSSIGYVTSLPAAASTGTLDEFSESKWSSGADTGRLTLFNRISLIPAQSPANTKRLSAPNEFVDVDYC